MATKKHEGEAKVSPVAEPEEVIENSAVPFAPENAMASMTFKSKFNIGDSISVSGIVSDINSTQGDEFAIKVATVNGEFTIMEHHLA